jgi:hypothetical protein
MTYEASKLQWTSPSYMPSSTSSLHKTYHHQKKLMRSETYFKSKKHLCSFIQHRKILQEQLQNQKSSSLTTLLSAEEEELDEEERHEERRRFLLSLFLAILLGLNWLPFLLTPP